MSYRSLDRVFGRDARDRSDEFSVPGVDGAIATLETFYRAFNSGDIDLFRRIWINDPHIRLKNPLGGVLEGIEPIVKLYDGIFNGPADVWVELGDIVVYDLRDAVVFSGRERGAFTRSSISVALDIRTTRVMHYAGGRWGQIHHHGSITDTAALETYRSAVRGSE